MNSNLMHLLTKPSDVTDGVTVRYISHVSIRQTQTHREMESLYGDYTEWPNLSLILWICDAQTQSIDVTDAAPDVWKALAAYLNTAPQSLSERMRFYQFLPPEIVNEWYTGYDSVRDKTESDVPLKPDSDDPN